MGQRIFRISGQLFVDLFGTGKRSYEVIEDPIPEDAKIVNAMFTFGYTSNSDLLVVKLESAEWPDTLEGKLIEEICPTMRTSRSEPQGILLADVLVMMKAVHEKGSYSEDCCHFCHAELFDGNGARERHKPDCLFFQIEDFLKEHGQL